MRMRLWAYKGIIYMEGQKQIWGRGVAFYVQNHLPVKVRKDIMYDEIEVLSLQVNLPHIKTYLGGLLLQATKFRSTLLRSHG